MKQKILIIFLLLVYKFVEYFSKNGDLFHQNSTHRHENHKSKSIIINLDKIHQGTSLNEWVRERPMSKIALWNNKKKQWDLFLFSITIPYTDHFYMFFFVDHTACIKFLGSIIFETCNKKKIMLICNNVVVCPCVSLRVINK